MIAFISGIIAGIAGGMGIGGGAILIPALTLILGLEQHMAQGVNLVFFIPTSVSALIIYIKNKTIDYKKASLIAIAGVAGAVGGSYISALVNGGFLRKLFAVLLIVFGILEIFKRQEK
ncbi:MAG: sulfite exporter TauE/SafE family protein [Bacillota bacterium]|nr:sulfite exporter TauE/SafE family protein [Bacillota bacterium]